MSGREFASYTAQGLKDLGECIRYWRERVKPDWTPAVSISVEQLCQERVGWTQIQMVQIMCREFNLYSGNADEDKTLVSRLRSELQRIELPPSTAREPNSIEMLDRIASLEICINPLSKAPYRMANFLEICKEQLDWRTGKPFPVKAPSKGTG
jgi:hypothetical protein